MIPASIKRHFKNCKKLELEDRVTIYNEMTELLRDMLEMKHPALAVKMIEAEKVHSNDYNPNKVAPPEMDLLELSMLRDGVTMPILAAKDDKGRYVIVDGFHRTQVMKYYVPVESSLLGYVPVVELNKDIAERIASTVRHNMARGAHKTELSARLVSLLKKHSWSDKKIGKELGMEPDEVLRLKQLTGLAEAFSDQEFSKSWE